MGDFPEAFTREQGLTLADWRRSLPGAAGAHAIGFPAPDRARIDIGAGRLELDWTELPPRRIALLQMPRLEIRYRFAQVDADARREFMRYFDLYLRRGGG